MCGIVGFLEFRPSPSSADLIGRMTASLAHRGPEGQGTHLIRSDFLQVGLGHTRLKIIDLSDNASQPMSNQDGTVWITFNGEIYNFKELRASLQQKSVAFRSASDTEVILHLYEAEGEAALSKLEGMFALAIWDGRRKTLLLARDRLGKKPLFYWASPHCFAFASEIKALFKHPAISPDVNPRSIPAFFFYGYVPTPHTFYQGILKLLPGHLLRVDGEGQVEIKPYWELSIPPASVSSSRPADRLQEEAPRRVRELVWSAVNRRLISDVPLGAFLSGGLDSSIVVGIMSRVMKEPVRTFSIGFSGDRRFNETSYARLAAKRFRTIHQEFTLEPIPVNLVERLVWHHDGPFADSSAIPTYLLSRLTREQVTVALNGDGGDELFAGYLRFPAAVFMEQLPSWVGGATHALFSKLPPWGGHRHPLRHLRKFAAAAHRPLIERYSQWVSVFFDDLNRLIPGSGTTVPDLLLRLQPVLDRCEGASALTRLLYLNLKTYLLDDLLVKIDRCSMAHALETRSPFLDRALVEYLFSLPDALKLQRGRTKAILRQAFADLLPPEILRRGKMGFGVPLQAWFKDSLRDFLCDSLLSLDARLRRYVDPQYVRQLVQAHLAHRADHSHRLWALLTFEVWLRKPVERE